MAVFPALDNDTLLVLALAYILYKQNADLKPVIALLSVLLA